MFAINAIHRLRLRMWELRLFAGYLSQFSPIIITIKLFCFVIFIIAFEATIKLIIPSFLHNLMYWNNYTSIIADTKSLFIRSKAQFSFIWEIQN
jgi:hypothetical protein